MSSSYNYVVTAHRPTVATHAATANFTSPNEQNLILAKNTRLEIQLLTAEGLQPLFDLPVYGQITTLQVFRPRNESQDLLFLCTESRNFCVLAFDSARREIVTRSQGDLSDRFGRPVEQGQLCTVDPRCRAIVLQLYEALLKIVPLNAATGATEEAFNARVDDIHIVSICCVDSPTAPLLLVMSEGPDNTRRVRAYEINFRSRELTPSPLNQWGNDAAASMLIPVKAPIGGCLIVSDERVTYSNGRASRTKDIKRAPMCAYTAVDANRLLLGDSYGSLSVLTLTADSNHQVVALSTDVLGQISPPTALAYLDSGVAYVGSASGDAQLIRLLSEPQNNQFVEVLDTFTNLGPIQDMAVIDLDRQGQSQVLTCSGTQSSGSLRLISSGVAIDVQAEVDLEGICGAWSLRNHTADEHDTYLVQAFGSETRILSFQSADDDSEQLGECSIAGFDCGATSLCCANVANDLLVQVTSNAVRLIEAQSGALRGSWSPAAGRITTAAANLNHVLCAIGTQLVLLAPSSNGFTEVSSARMPHEVACLSIGQTDDRLACNWAAVGLWEDCSVHILRLPDLATVGRENTLASASDAVILPRSLLLCTLGNSGDTALTTFSSAAMLLSSVQPQLYLFCGLGDGTLIAFKLDHNSVAVIDKKRISIGSQPITLSHVLRRGHDGSSERHVFASCDWPTLISAARGGALRVANVNIGQVNYMTSFHTAAFPGSVALCSTESLTIGTIGDLQRLHVHTVPLNFHPRRIAHHASSRLIAVVGVEHIRPENAQLAPTGSGANQYLLETSHIALCASPPSCDVLDRFALAPFEQGSAILATTLPAHCNVTDMSAVFIVGTSFVYPEEEEPSKGRVLILGVNSQSRFQLLGEYNTQGAVFTLAEFGERLLCTINSRVQLLNFVVADQQLRLKPHAAHTGHILALYVKTFGDYILVGDLMKSMTLLVYRASVDGSSESAIEEVARDLQSNWMTAVQFHGDSYLGTEQAGNMFVLRRSADAPTAEDRARLEECGRFHIGELVNVFREGSLVMSASPGDAMEVDSEDFGAIRASQLFGTVHGMLGVVAALNATQFVFLSALQTALQTRVRAIGNFSHSKWRQFSNDYRVEQSLNFIDGDLIELFLELKHDVQAEVASVISVPVDEILRRVEELTRIH